MKVAGLLIVTMVLAIFVERTVMLTEFEELEKLLENYDRRVRPDTGGPAVTVRVSVYVLNIPEVRFGQHGMEMTVEMYFRQFWQDNRLKRNNSGKILGEKDVVEKIWVPDTFFVNEHSSLAKEQFLRISAEGAVLWSQRMQVTFTAYGDYTNFPFDSQIFPLEFESFKYNVKDVCYGWQDGDNSVLLNPDSGFTDLTIAGHAQRENLVSLSFANYSRVWIQIQVDRNSGFYFSILFTPLFMTTILSFSTFWVIINHRLLFILLINIFTIIFKVWFRVSMIPPVGYSVCAVEYIDMCLSITLLVLIETFIISFMESSNSTTSAGTLELENINLNEESNIQVLQRNSVHSGQRCCGVYYDLGRIHNICKFLIPTLFIIFQVCFWLRVTFQETMELEGIVRLHQ